MAYCGADKGAIEDRFTLMRTNAKALLVLWKLTADAVRARRIMYEAKNLPHT